MEAENRSTRQSIPVARLTALFPVESSHTRTRLSACPRATPSATPPHASTALSASECRSRRARDAPSAMRTAISRSRALARASIRFARLATGDQQHQAGDDQQ